MTGDGGRGGFLATLSVPFLGGSSGGRCCCCCCRGSSLLTTVTTEDVELRESLEDATEDAFVGESGLATTGCRGRQLLCKKQLAIK